MGTFTVLQQQTMEKEYRTRIINIYIYIYVSKKKTGALQYRQDVPHGVPWPTVSFPTSIRSNCRHLKAAIWYDINTKRVFIYESTFQ